MKMGNVKIATRKNRAKRILRQSQVNQTLRQNQESRVNQILHQSVAIQSAEMTNRCEILKVTAKANKET